MGLKMSNNENTGNIEIGMDSLMDKTTGCHSQVFGKQSSIEYLMEMVSYTSKDTYNAMNDSGFFEQAKQMEYEQIINAHTNGQAEFDTEAFRQKVVDNAEKYYNETYNK